MREWQIVVKTTETSVYNVVAETEAEAREAVLGASDVDQIEGLLTATSWDDDKVEVEDLGQWFGDKPTAGSIRA